MARRYYSSTAARTTLASPATDVATSIIVTAVSGYPATYPYTMAIDSDTVNEEVVLVTNRSGTTLTVTRGQVGTSAVAHSAGADVRHVLTAQDLDEANAHVNDTTTDVHPQYVLESLVDAKGDLFTATANNAPARLAVGADNTVLTADSSQATGLKWATASAIGFEPFFTIGV